jgi:hypothetical protein
LKYIETFFSLLIIAFWISMNALLISREAELEKVGQFKAGIQGYLAGANLRESWMTIRSKGKRIGYSGYTVEKLYIDGGNEYHIGIETVYRGRLPVPTILASFLPDNRQFELNGLLVLDEDMRPLSLRMNLSLATFRRQTETARASFLLVGRDRGDQFLVELFHEEDEAALLAVKLPSDKLTLSNGLAPTIPIAGLKQGRTYRVPVFDPLSSLGFGSESATIEVLRKEARKIEGLFVDTWVVETRYGSKTISSWVTSGGEVLRQELGPPLDLVMTKVTNRKRALEGLGKRTPGTGK